MKVNNKQLFEVQLNQQAPQNVAANSSQQQSTWDMFSALGAKQFLQERRKKSLPLDITVPGDFYNQLSIPAAPQDIAVVMSTIKTNKAKKTRDLEKWGMVDPISTYGNAEDCCYKVFNSFSNRINFAQSKEEMKANKQDIQTSNESVNYYNYKPLNESALTTGVLFGEGVGSIAGTGLTFLMATGASFAASIAPQVAIIATSADLIGKVGERIFGDVDRNDKNNADDVKTHLNAETIARNSTTMPMQYGNVVDAIDKYIDMMIQETRNLITGISSNLAKTYTSEFANFIINSKGVLAEESKKFITDNSKYLQDMKKQQEENRHNRDIKELNTERNIANFISSIQNYAMPKKDLDLMETTVRLGEWIRRNFNSEKGQKVYNEFQDNGEKAAIDYYVKNYDNKDKQLNKLNTSIDFSQFKYRVLNEDTNNDNERIVLNLDAYYGALKRELTTRLSFLDEFDPKTMTNLAETKQTMEDMIKTADETIKNKIQIVTNASSSPSAAKESGLGQAAIQFLMGHPLEANNLTEIWSRHLADLKTRMNNRLKIMTDYNNANRILGWTFTMLRETLPDFFARMLTYRYAYAILSNNGVYTYNTTQAERDLQEFDAPDPNGGPSLRESYLNSTRAQLIFILNNFSSDYTDGGNCVDVDENGGYKLNGNTIRYGSLLMNRIFNGASSDIKELAGTTLANLSNDNNGFEHLISIIYGNMIRRSVTDNATLEQLIADFRLTDNMRKLKNNIKTTYDTIVNDIAKKALDSINGDNGEETAENIANSLYIINTQGPRNIYSTYNAHKNEINTLIEAFNNTKKIDDSKKEEKIKKLEKCRNDVQKFFNNIDFKNIPENTNNAYKETIEKVFDTSESKGKNDYYCYILSWYSTKDALASTALGTNVFALNEIQDICKMTPVLLNLAVSGILAYNMKAEKEDKENANKETDLKTQIKAVSDEFINIKSVKTAMDNMEKDHKDDEDYQKLANEYKELENKVKEQISLKYKTDTDNEKYQIKGIATKNDLLKEADEPQPTEITSNSNWFEQLLDVFTKYNNTNDADKLVENIKLALGPAKIRIKADEKDKDDKVIDFSQLENDTDKNNIILSLVNAMNKAYMDGDVQALIDTLSKKLNIDINKDYEKVGIETKLKNELSSINDTFNNINKAKESIEELKNSKDTGEYAELAKKYIELENTVKTQISKAYGGIKSKYVIQGIVKGTSLSEANNQSVIEEKSSDENTNKDWFKQLIDAMLLYSNGGDINKILENIKLALGDVKVTNSEKPEDKKVFKEVDPADQNVILLNLADAINKAIEDGNVKDLINTLNEKLGLEKQDQENLTNIRKQLPNLIYSMYTTINKLLLVDTFDNIQDDKYAKLKSQLKEAKSAVSKQITNNYIDISNKSQTKYQFEIDNITVFYNNFYKCLTTFINLNGGQENHITIESAVNGFNNSNNIKVKNIKSKKSVEIKTIGSDDMQILLYNIGLAFQKAKNENGRISDLQKILDKIIKYYNQNH